LPRNLNLGFSWGFHCLNLGFSFVHIDNAAEMLMVISGSLITWLYFINQNFTLVADVLRFLLKIV